MKIFFPGVDIFLCAKVFQGKRSVVCAISAPFFALCMNSFLESTQAKKKIVIIIH